MSKLRFSSGAVTLGEYETGHARDQRHRPRPDRFTGNCDAVMADETGLYVADGVGKSQGAAAASILAVTGAARLAEELDLRHFPMDQVVTRVQDSVLPRIDQNIGDFRRQQTIKQAATALGALFVAADGLVAAVIGNPRIYWARDMHMHRVGPDQSIKNGLTNTLAGNGRPTPSGEPLDTETGGRYSREMITDYVQALAVAPGDRLAIMTDGLSGEAYHPSSELPENLILGNLLLGRGYSEANALSPQTHASYFMDLPRRFEACNALLETPGGPRYYYPRPDDCSVGIMYVD